jgi:hypothetical protein
MRDKPILKGVARTFPLTRITFDQWQGAHMAERLRAFLKCSVSTVMCDPIRLDRHAAMLKGAFSGRHVRLPNHVELVEQLENLIGAETRRRDKVRFTSGSGSGAGAHDDLVVALCLSAEADAASIGARRLPEMEACPLEVYHGRAGVSCFLWDPAGGVIAPDPGICNDCVGLRAVREALAAHVARGGADTGVRAFYAAHFSPNELVKRKRSIPAYNYFLVSAGL